MMEDRVYIGDFSGWGHDEENTWGSVCSQFQISMPEPRFVFAAYETPNYEGYATVITSEDGQTFDLVEGSHCSCYGLEGQYETTEHAADEVLHMIKAADFGALSDNREAALEWLGHVTMQVRP